MTKHKKRPMIGDECWFVEWAYEPCFDGGGDIDPYNCKEHEQIVATKEEAEKVAHEVWPESCNVWGVVNYYPARFVPYDEDDALVYPHVGFWEPIGDTIEYSGP